MFIEDGFGSGIKAQVDAAGRLEVHATSAEEQSVASEEGEAWNLNTGNITLTNDVATPVFYLKNVSSDRPLKINRIFFATGPSTGGSGVLNAHVVSNPSGGTLLSGTDLPLYSFNFGSAKTVGVNSKIGATGLTTTGGEIPIKFLFPTVPAREAVPFRTIELPRGSSMAVYMTPPPGNTSMIVQAGCNIYLKVD